MQKKGRSIYGPPPMRIYIVESLQGALVAFEAQGTLEARQLLKEGWFLDELAEKMLYPEDNKLSVRWASPEEASAYELALKLKKETDDLFLAYLK